MVGKLVLMLMCAGESYVEKRALRLLDVDVGGWVKRKERERKGIKDLDWERLEMLSSRRVLLV